MPQDYKAKLSYGEEEKLYSGVFKHTWYRYVSGIFVSNEHLEVEVDSSSGEIVAWMLSLFSYPENKIKTNPAISYEVSQKISEIRFDAEPVGFNPILIIDRDKPIWVAKVKSLFPFFVAVNALDGNVMYSGSLRDELPDNYDYGREVEIIETDSLRGIYNG